MDASRTAKRIRFHNFAALEKARAELLLNYYFDCHTTFGFVNPSLTVRCSFVVNHRKNPNNMKKLVSPGTTLIVTANLRTPVRRGNHWPDHGNLIATGPGLVTPPPYSTYAVWQLKDGTQFTYAYGRDAYGVTIQNWQALNYVTKVNGLFGGEFYNRFLRNRIFTKT